MIFFLKNYNCVQNDKAKHTKGLQKTFKVHISCAPLVLDGLKNILYKKIAGCKPIFQNFNLCFKIKKIFFNQPTYLIYKLFVFIFKNAYGFLFVFFKCIFQKWNVVIIIMYIIYFIDVLPK